MCRCRVRKHPHIADYGRAVTERDEVEFTNLTNFIRELRDNYAVLYDVIQKNLEKIIKPKGDNEDIMLMTA